MSGAWEDPAVRRAVREAIANETRDDDDICGGVVPDEMCGQCPDCRQDLDAWRETYEVED